MKTITIEELHRETGKFVHAAAAEDVVVVEQGKPVAVLKGPVNSGRFDEFWQQREQQLASIPAVAEDSTAYVSEDRDRR